MPNGRRHNIACATVAVSSASALFIYSPSAAFWCATGALAGLLLSPDLDIENNSIHHIRKYAGLPASALWFIAWWPYRKLCKHRGFWSHAPVVSTAIRLLYLSALAFPLRYWLKFPLPTFTTGMGWWILGLTLADFSHFVLDYADSKLGGRL